MVRFLLVPAILLLVVGVLLQGCGTNANDVSIAQEQTNRAMLESLLAQQQSLLTQATKPVQNNASLWALAVVLVVALLVGGYVISTLVRANQQTTQAAITALSAPPVPHDLLPLMVRQALLEAGLEQYAVRINPVSKRFEIVDDGGAVVGQSYLTANELLLEDGGNHEKSI